MKRRKMDFKRIDELAAGATAPIGDTWLEELRARIHGPSAHPYIRFLHNLALETEPPVIVELGVEWGVTSAFLCAAAARYGGHVVGVDDVNTHEIVERLIPGRFGNYTFLRANSVDAAGRVRALCERYGKIGLMFQDTRHATQWREWELYSPLLAKGAVWVKDDADNEVWDRYPARKRKYAGLHEGVTMGVVLP